MTFPEEVLIKELDCRVGLLRDIDDGKADVGLAACQDRPDR